MEEFKKEVGTKITEQLPKGISLETFWKVVKFNEQRQGGNNPYKPGRLEDLKEGLYTDKIIGQTIEQIDREYKGGNV